MNKQPLSQSFFTLRNFLWFVAIFLVICIAIMIGYFIGFSQAENELEIERAQSKYLSEEIRKIAEIDEKDIYSSTKEDSELLRLKKELEVFIERERSASSVVKAQHEYSSSHVPPPRPIRPIAQNPKEAKLVIIIDDVSYAHDVKAIKSIGLPLVMSFLPPNTRHPESAKIATSYMNSMVHLPLEALKFSDEETMTLKISDSEDVIAKRIMMLKQLYPNVRFYNNHTGSKFTADSDAMERLIRVMKKEGLTFVDSRTTGQTKAPEITKKLGIRYIGRDVFLDHDDGVKNIKNQIQEAIAVAKRHGSAIAIGHPRPDTIRALRESKAMLEEVQLVGIEQI